MFHFVPVYDWQLTPLNKYSNEGQSALQAIAFYCLYIGCSYFYRVFLIHSNLFHVAIFLVLLNNFGLSSEWK